jgi:hypothetical protein
MFWVLYVHILYSSQGREECTLVGSKRVLASRWFAQHVLKMLRIELLRTV